MYKVEFSTIEDIIGTHIQFEHDPIQVGDKLYLGKDILTIDSVMMNDAGAVVTADEQFIKLKKL